MGFFKIFAAIPGFFISSLILWALWNKAIAERIGLELINYKIAMLITITLWLAVAPFIAAASRSGKPNTESKI